MPDDNHLDRSAGPPLQFGLRTLLVLTAAFGLLFATLKWLGVPPLASFIVLVVLTVSVLAAIGLVVAIAGWVPGEEDDDDRDLL